MRGPVHQQQFHPVTIVKHQVKTINTKLILNRFLSEQDCLLRDSDDTTSPTPLLKDYAVSRNLAGINGSG